MSLTPTLSARYLARQLALATLLLVLGPFGSAGAAVVSSTWNFGSGGGDGVSWSDAGNWTNSDGSHRTPQHTATDSFSVTIPSPAVTTLTSLSPDVDSLMLNGTLHVGDSTLTIINPFTNNGTIQLVTGNLAVTNGTLTNEGSISVQILAIPNAIHTIEASLINQGEMTVEPGGRLLLIGANHANTGTITIGAGADLRIVRNGTFNMNGGVINNQGTFKADLLPVTFNFNAGTVTGNPPLVGSLSIASTAGAGSFILRGTGDLSGDIAANQKVILQAGSFPLTEITAADGFTNRGILEWSPEEPLDAGSPRSALKVPGTLVNEGTLSFHGRTDDKTAAHQLEGDLTNNALIELGTQSDVNIRKIGATFLNHGTVKLGVNSSIFVDGFGTGVFTNAADGLIEGLGGLGVSGMFLNEGTLSTGPVAGVISFFGDYNQSDTGILRIGINANSPGRIRGLSFFLNTATLDGDLEVMLLNSFVPSPSDTFMMVKADSIIGEFDNTPGNMLVTPDGTFQVNYTSTEVFLSNFQPIPEPGTLGLTLCGAVMVAFCAWRTRR